MEIDNIPKALCCNTLSAEPEDIFWLECHLTVQNGPMPWKHVTPKEVKQKVSVAWMFHVR